MKNRFLRPKTGLKLFCIALIMIMMAMAFASIVPVVEEADSWEAYNPIPTSSAGKSGYAYQDVYRDNWNYGTTTSSTVGEDYYYSSYYNRDYYYNYNGWLGFDVSSIPSNANINSITLDINFAYVWAHDGSIDMDLYVNLLYSNPYNLGEGESIYDACAGGYYLGYRFIRSAGRQTFSISGTPLTQIKNMIANGDDTIYFGIEDPYGYAYREYAQISGSSTYLKFNLDRSAPTVPVINTLNEYQNSTTVTIDQYSYDLPLNGNTSGVEYQIGLFSNETSSNPFQTYEWTSYESIDLTQMVDGQKYYIRSRSRDANEFTSAWSDCINTTIDISPPTVPILSPHEIYTEGTSVTLDWTESTDVGIGLDTYVIQRSTNLLFTSYDEMEFGPGNSTYTYTNCVDGETYYFRMMSNDTFDQWCGPCPVVMTTMDDEAPTVPVMITEPVYTKGMNNTYSWYPAVDAGIGMDHYQVQLCPTPDFQAYEIMYDDTTTETYITFDGLDDATMYYVRARSIDEFGYESEWSTHLWSIQDDTGPGEPGLLSQMEYQMDGPVLLEWQGSVDDGAGVGWYKVEWSQDMNFVEDVEMKDHALGQSMTIADLDPGVKWHFRVTPVDTLENVGVGETTYTTLDAAPPELSLVDEMTEFTIGNNKTVQWSASIDDVSGTDHYLLEVFSDMDATIKTFEIHTTKTEFNVPGLVDGMTYYYRVTVFDVAGNSITSGTRLSTQDSSAPVIELTEGELFGGDDSNVEGSVFDLTSGVAAVEVSTNDGETWQETPLSSETWSYNMDSIPPGTTHIWVRGIDNVGNTGEPTIVMIDNSMPMIEIISPETSSLINGPVQIIGVLEDAHMASYSIDYKLSGTEYWMPMVPMQSSLEFTGVLGTWLPMGLDDGDYFIKVTATDTLGQSSEIVFNLTLEQAELDLGSSSITFSDPKPTVGETVTVSVEVANGGDSDAKGVTIVIFDNGEEIKKEVGLDIPAGESAIIQIELLVTGNHSITARADSDRYDTGEMEGGSRIVAIVPEPEVEPPKEGFLEDSAGVLGLFALIIGLLAIIVAIILGVILSRRKPEEAKEAEVKEPEGPAGMPAAPEKPALPSSTRPPIVPRPTLPPTTAAPPAAPATPPPADPTPAPAQEPQFQAPPTEAPVQQAEPPAQPAPAPVQQATQPAPAPAPAQQLQVNLPQQ